MFLIYYLPFPFLHLIQNLFTFSVFRLYEDKLICNIFTCFNFQQYNGANLNEIHFEDNLPH